MKPENLIPGEGGNGRVFAFWGNATWSRTQLLGEIARGHWGLCKGSTADIVAKPSLRWEGLHGRLGFAPVTEMTEEFMRKARREMDTYRATGQSAQDVATPTLSARSPPAGALPTPISIQAEPNDAEAPSEDSTETQADEAENA